ncbi:MAG: ABC transporter permease, partial [Anaerolineales bacterium]|nr:ABC transporter permease [Anaerolineales bacterium]
MSETNLVIAIIAAGIFTGTPLLIATLGELITERSGVINLGVEGMMLVGALAGFAVAVATSNPWAGLAAAILAGGILSLLHAFVSITLRGEQVVSGLALTFVGVGLTAVLGAPYVQIRNAPQLPRLPIPILTDVPVLGQIFANQSVVVYIGFALVPLTWAYIRYTRPGMHMRAVGEYPTAADASGINVYFQRYLYVFVGGMFAGLAGAALSLAVTPLWIENMTAGMGWVAVGLVIFARWDPWRAAIGAYIFGALFRMPLDLQSVVWLPFASNPILGVWLRMLPYLFPVIVLALTSRGAARRRLGP